MPEAKNVQDLFEEGVNQQAANKWLDRTAESSDRYESGFEPYYKAQLECADEIAGKGGFAALQAYANCMKSWMQEK